MSNDYHIPVLLNESISALDIKPGAIVVDATLGGSSHSRAILESNSTLQLYSFDQDIDAIEHAKSLAEEYKGRLTLIHDNFVNIRTRLALERVGHIDAVLFDLGVSSHQIDTPERGFSYMQDGELDMRMDKRQPLTAQEVVNSYSHGELTRIFREYGEERESSRIASAICAKREQKRIITTLELTEIIDRTTRSKMKIKARTRIFQALRIHINQELEVLKKALQDTVNILNPGGRIAVISFSSLEDRIVKSYFNYESLDCICPSNFPKCLCNKEKRLVLHKSVTPKEEAVRNVRSRSARLRFATRVAEKE